MKFSTGDKVRWKGGEPARKSYKRNYSFLETGVVYTVSSSHEWNGLKNLMFREINEKHPEGPYYLEEDFELVSEFIDPDEAWNRAMGIL